MQAINRRSLLKSSLTTLAVSPAIPLLSALADNTHTPPKPVSCCDGLNHTLIATATAAHIITTANTYACAVKSEDWANMASTCSAVAANMKSSGYDAKVIACANSINATQLNPAYINRNAVVQAVQVYQPSFTRTNLDAYMASLPLDPAHLSGALNRIRQYGISPQIAWSAQRFASMAAWLNTSANQQNAVAIVLANPKFHSLGAGTPLKPQKPPKREQGGGGYSCGDDAVASLAVGTAIGVIAIMAAPEMAAVLAGGAILNAIIGWGGAAAGVWALGHAVVCGF